MCRQTSAPIRTNGGSELADIRDSGLHFNRECPVRIDAQGDNARRRARLQLIVNRQRRVTLLAGHPDVSNEDREDVPLTDLLAAVDKPSGLRAITPTAWHWSHFSRCNLERTFTLASYEVRG